MILGFVGFLLVRVCVTLGCLSTPLCGMNDKKKLVIKALRAPSKVKPLKAHVKPPQAPRCEHLPSDAGQAFYFRRASAPLGQLGAPLRCAPTPNCCFMCH